MALGLVLALALLAGLAVVGVRVATGPRTSTLPAAAPPTPTAASGLAGTIRVDWANGGLTYTAVISATGATGRAVIRYTDDPTYGGAVIQESLALDGGAGRYVGSDVRDLGPPIYAKNYRPDAFYLTSADGRVTVDRVCDVQGNAGARATTTVR